MVQLHVDFVFHANELALPVRVQAVFIHKLRELLADVVAHLLLSGVQLLLKGVELG